MKKRVIIGILSFLILFLFSKSNKVSANLFEIDYLEEDGPAKLEKFLAGAKSSGNTIEIQDCLPGSVFEIKKTIVNPPELTVGQNIKIKVIGAMKEENMVAKLHIVSYLNNQIIFSTDVAKSENVKKGLWFWEFEIGVPTFVPKGHWQNYAYVINQKDENISCLLAIFDA